MNIGRRPIKIKARKPNYVFNLLNGNIRKLDYTRRKGEFEIFIWSLPKNHKKCYGRGYIGTNVKTKFKIVCNCLYRNKPTYEEFYKGGK